MKFDFMRNKVFIISFIILILFSFFNHSFADTLSDLDDSTINYNIDNSLQDLNSSFSDFKNSKYYNSSDYYYFIFYEYWSRSNNIVVVKKSDISLSSLPMYVSDYEYNWRSFVLDLGEFDLSSKFIHFCGSNGVSYNYDISKHTTIKFAGLYDSSSRTFTIPFISNFPEITKVRANNESFTFFQAPPQILIPEMVEVGQLPEIMMKVIKILLPIGLIVFAIGLLIYVIKRVIYSMR